MVTLIYDDEAYNLIYIIILTKMNSSFTKTLALACLLQNINPFASDNVVKAD